MHKVASEDFSFPFFSSSGTSTASERAAPPTSSPIRRGKRSLAGATPRLH